MIDLSPIFPMDGYFSRGTLDRPVDKAIILIGTGGTGGYLIPHLVRFMSLVNRKRRAGAGTAGLPDSLHLVIVDGDVVEEKNLVRQNFVLRDVGRPKAQVLAERYSAAFGLEIGYFNGFLESPEKIQALICSQPVTSAPIVVSCVDNNKTRKLIWDWYRARSHYTDTFWLDCGNEEHHGQVVLGHRGGRTPLSMLQEWKNMDCPAIPHQYQLPCFFEVFPNAFDQLGMLPSEERAVENCAQRAVNNPQTIFVNMMAAQVALNFLKAILEHAPIDHHMAWFRTTDNSCRPERLTEKSIPKIHDTIQDFDRKLVELDLYQTAYGRPAPSHLMPTAAQHPEGVTL